MKTENCCFCFHIASGGNAVDSDILELLKFLIVNLNTSALENCTVCDSCLSKIVETSEYKRNSMKTLVDTKKEINCEKSICQKCEKVSEQGDTFPLMDCVTQFDWSDFVNYLFPDQDSKSLEILQICGSCRESVSNIQDFLKLIYIHDQSKMKCDIDNSDNIIITENENLMRDKVEIKQEFKNFIVNDKTEIQNLIEDNKAEMTCSDSKGDGDTTYTDFKCKNEEVELKFENDDQSFDRCEKVDVDKEITWSGCRNKNSCSKEEKEQEMNTQGCSNKLKYDLKVQNNIPDFRFSQRQSVDDHLLKCHKNKNSGVGKIHKCDKCSYSATKKTYLTRHLKIHNNNRDLKKCTFCSKTFTRKSYLDDHLLQVHKNKESVTSKIHECDKCSYSTTKITTLLRHRLKHGIAVGLKKYQCQNCIYETYDKTTLIRHIKTHNNTRDFQCTLCSKSFIKKVNLDDHLLKVHKNKDSVVSKIHECDKCSYLTTKKGEFLEHKKKHDITIGLEKYKYDKCNYSTTIKRVLSKHNLKHGITAALEKYECNHCTYETYNKSHFIKHIETHYGIRDFKCTLCSKTFTRKSYLDNHLLQVHKNKGSVTSKIHECDKCSYSTTKNDDMLRHKIKHGIKVDAEKYKCEYCIYETYFKYDLTKHIKKHYKKNIRLEKYKCDECNYSTTRKSDLLKHKLRHRIKVGLEKYKCYHCTYETYYKIALIAHIKTHYDVRDFKCTLCSKRFSHKIILDEHLLRIHKNKKGVTNKIYECEKCHYFTTFSGNLTRHLKGHVSDDELATRRFQAVSFVYACNTFSVTSVDMDKMILFTELIQ